MRISAYNEVGWQTGAIIVDQGVGSVLLMIGAGGVALSTIWELRDYRRGEMLRSRFLDHLVGSIGIIAAAGYFLVPGVASILAFALMFLALGVVMGRRWERRSNSAAQSELGSKRRCDPDNRFP